MGNKIARRLPPIFSKNLRQSALNQRKSAFTPSANLCYRSWQASRTHFWMQSGSFAHLSVQGISLPVSQFTPATNPLLVRKPVFPATAE
jgi:hypothetical protein